MVAVWMVTYNHDEFIENAIESVMMQKCSFKYKLLIGEDNSTDKTREICKKIKEKYADKIELILHKKNIGANPNGIYMYKKCLESGAKYIALLEGDDYWLDTYKLQKQVDFLEKNLDYSFCSTNIHVLNLKNNLFSKTDASELIQNKSYHDSDLIHFLNPYLWYTCTIVFRSSILDKNFIFDKNNNNFKDIFLFSILLKESKCRFMNEFTTVYRVHDNGVWSTISS